jgi:hypothetical protein
MTLDIYHPEFHDRRTMYVWEFQGQTRLSLRRAHGRYSDLIGLY